MSSRPAKTKPRILLGASAWIAYARGSVDELKYIEANAEILGVDEQVIERALDQGLAPNVDGLLRAVASLHHAQLISVEDVRIVHNVSGP